MYLKTLHLMFFYAFPVCADPFGHKCITLHFTRTPQQLKAGTYRYL